ncbi:hypothetical protein ONZ45_g9962 [Pleurotus djamor]|nr:hypothetical protein ONZ45_g9962 [Pleurotus djamor]
MPLFTDLSTQIAIDKELAFHRAAIQRLSLHRNKLSAVNQLPIEVLAHIFLIYKDGFHLFEEKEDEFEGSNMEGHWTNVLCVCTHWRNIVLDTPRFWSSVALSPGVLIQDPSLPRRSKLLPLSVYFAIFQHDEETSCYNPEELSAVEEFVSKNLFRCRRIFLGFEYPTISDFESLLTIMGRYSAPSLRSLEIRLNPDEDGDFPNLEIYQISSSSLGFMSSLFVLKLIDVLIPLECPHLPHLNTLVVESTARIRTLPVDWIVAFLRKMPNIEFVHLDEVSSSSPTPSSSARVSLPALRSLDICGEDCSAAAIFDVLDTPLASLKTSYTTHYAFHNSDISALNRFCTAFTSAQPDSTAFKLVMNLRSRDLSLRTFDDDASSPTLTLCLQDIEIPSFLEACSKTPLSQVTELSVQIRCLDIGISEWQHIILGCVNLQSLDFSQSDLSIRHYIPPAGNPRLGTLSFTDIDVRGLEATSKLNDLMNTLKDYCNQRREAGHGLQKVIVRECHIPSGHIDALREVVEVDWDGKGGEELDP